LSSNRDSVMKEYATDEIVVEWEPRLCSHSRNCVRSLPQVFDKPFCDGTHEKNGFRG
jgi:uncharacterized Fe-S cluster protein YjdI